jgi:VanZ family protein
MISQKKFIPGIAWFFLVLILLVVPGSQFPKTDDWLDKIFFDKWVHTGLFAILAFLFMYPIVKSDIERRIKINIIIKIAIATIVWGLATEFIQKYFATRRSFDLLDWASDSIGAIIALYFCHTKYLKKN